MFTINVPDTHTQAHQAQLQTILVCSQILESQLISAPPEKRSALTKHLVHLDTIKERLEHLQRLDLNAQKPNL